LAFAAARLRIPASDRRYPAVDIIARPGSVLAASDVKAQPDNATTPLLRRCCGSATPRRRIARVIAAFPRRPELARWRRRFDVMVVEPRRLRHHLPGARQYRGRPESTPHFRRKPLAYLANPQAIAGAAELDRKPYRAASLAGLAVGR